MNKLVSPENKYSKVYFIWKYSSHDCEEYYCSYKNKSQYLGDIYDDIKNNYDSINLDKNFYKYNMKTNYFKKLCRNGFEIGFNKYQWYDYDFNNCLKPPIKKEKIYFLNKIENNKINKFIENIKVNLSERNDYWSFDSAHMYYLLTINEFKKLIDRDMRTNDDNNQEENKEENQEETKNKNKGKFIILEYRNKYYEEIHYCSDVSIEYRFIIHGYIVIK